MRRSIVGIAVGVGVGTWLGLTYRGGSWMEVAFVAVTVSLLVAHWLRRELVANICLHILVALFAWWLAALAVGEAIDALFVEHGVVSGSLATVRGKVVSDVSGFERTGGRAVVSFALKLSSVDIDGSCYSVSDVVQVLLYGLPKYPPVYGEYWRIKGRLAASHRRRSVRRRVSYRLVGGLRNAQREETSSGSIVALGYSVRRQVASMLTRGIEDCPDVCGVIKAMMLGYRSELPDNIRDSFRHTGTMHVFAISGLHIGILCSIIVFGLAVVGVERTRWVLFMAPLVAMYTVVTGGRASAIRAGIMAVAYLLAPLLRRRGDVVSALAFAALAILLWNPTQLVEIGFLYSFAVVAGIVAIVPVFERHLVWLWQADEFELPVVGGYMWWVRGGVRLLAGLVAVSVAAWLTSAPLSLYFFGRFSPVALLGNLIAVPLAFLILLTGCLSILSGVFVGVLGEVFNSANWVFVRMLTEGMQGLEKIPYGWIECGHLPLWGVVLWYMVLAGVVVGLSVRRSTGDEMLHSPAGLGFGAGKRG